MISINLTVFNKGFLIERVLNAIKENTVSEYEIVVVLDGCTDNSEEVVLNFFEKNYMQHKIFYTANVFETKANNIAAKNSEGDYIIIVQDDMIVNEFGWDERLIKPMKMFDDVFSVSANCAHDWVYNPKNKQIPEQYSDLLFDVNHAKKMNTPRDIFSIRTTSNRGPLAINRADLIKLNYFDEEFYPQICDDHDLHYRAYEKLGKVTGLYWTDFICDRNWGATRLSGADSWFIPATHKNYNLLWSRYKDQILNTRPAENRKIT